jgi:hypothetical protein
MRAKIVALLLSGALLAGALGTAASAGGATVVWQNSMMRVTRGSQPLTITFKNKIAHAITFRCSFLLSSSRTTVHGRLMPLERRRTQPATGVTASQFRCRTALAG